MIPVGTTLAELLNREIAELGMVAESIDGVVQVFEPVSGYIGKDLYFITEKNEYLTSFAGHESITGLRWMHIDYDYQFRHKEWISALDRQDQKLEREQEALRDRVRYSIDERIRLRETKF
jgi:hypothetical protein